jgi:hypothetical protein
MRWHDHDWQVGKDLEGGGCDLLRATILHTQGITEDKQAPQSWQSETLQEIRTSISQIQVWTITATPSCSVQLVGWDVADGHFAVQLVRKRKERFHIPVHNRPYALLACQMFFRQYRRITCIRHVGSYLYGGQTHPFLKVTRFPSSEGAGRRWPLNADQRNSNFPRSLKVSEDGAKWC